nr:hypothetical protein CFP56_66474 [Quercus suber]
MRKQSTLGYMPGVWPAERSYRTSVELGWVSAQSVLPHYARSCDYSFNFVVSTTKGIVAGLSQTSGGVLVVRPSQSLDWFTGFDVVDLYTAVRPVEVDIRVEFLHLLDGRKLFGGCDVGYVVHNCFRDVEQGGTEYWQESQGNVREAHLCGPVRLRLLRCVSSTDDVGKLSLI